ncbi:MAG: MFS transporter [Clostridiales Family XIII bacterium]|nr:MFS transporter [Clostridiales Family XIII bacterium]
MDSTPSYKKAFALAVAVVMMLCLGLLYAWSIFVVPLESEFGWTRDKTSMTFMISIICFCFGGVFSGNRVSKGRGGSKLLFLAAALMVAGFVLASRTEFLIQFYVFYGVFSGFGVGIAYNSVISSITKHFPGKTGAISGLLMVGFGMGAMVFGVLCANLIELLGWRPVFVLVGAFFGVVFVLGTIVIYNVFGKIRTGADAGETGGPKSEKENLPGLTLAQAVRRVDFWLVFCWIFLCGTCGLALIGHVSPAVQDMGAPRELAAVFAGIVSVFNGVGRVLAGSLIDRFGYIKIAFCVSFLMVVAVALLLLSTGTGSLGLFFATCCLTGLAFSALPVSSTTFCMSRYGPRDFSQNFAVMNLNLVVQAILGSGIFSIFLTRTGGGYAHGFFYLIPFAALGVVFCCLIANSLKRNPEKTWRV